MIIIMEKGATDENIQKVCARLEENGFQIRVNRGELLTVIDALGDKSSVSEDRLLRLKALKKLNTSENLFVWHPATEKKMTQ